MAFRTEWFSLNLSSDWVARDLGDPDRFNYFSARRQAEVVVSLMGFSANAGKLADVADRLLEIRKRAEVEIAAEAGLTVEFDESWARASPDGGTIQINFVGHDSQGGWFFSSGFVHDEGLLNIRGEVLGRDRAAIDNLFNEVLSSLQL